MRCRTCGVNLPAGVANCPNCGTAVPRPDETVVDPSAQEPFIPPTVYGGPVPPTPGYNSNMQNSYDRPPLPSSPSYNNQANQYPSSPYDSAGQNQYQPGFNNQPNQYPPSSYDPAGQNQYQPGAFNQSQAAPNQYPNQYTPGGMPPAYPPPGPGYMPPQQTPRRKTRWGLIIGIIAGVLILACIGASALFVGGVYSLGKTVNQQATATAAANTTVATPAGTNTTPAAATPAGTDTTPAANSNSTGASPSGLTVDTNAASIVTSAQSARNVDQNTAAAVDPTSTFKAGDRVYVVFKVNTDKIDFTTQKVYVGAKFYVDNVFAQKVDPITFDQAAPGGYFAGTYKVASKGTAELYLCYKSDCSDGKLAQVVNFTVA